MVHLLFFIIICCLVAAGDDDAVLGGFTTDHIDTRGLFVGEGHATNRGLSLFFDFCLSLGSAVPVAKEESAVLDFLLELLVVVALVNVLVAILAGLLEDVLLDIYQ